MAAKRAIQKHTTSKRTVQKRRLNRKPWIVTDSARYPSGQVLAYEMFEKRGERWEKITFEQMKERQDKYFPNAKFNIQRFRWLRSRYRKGMKIRRIGRAVISRKFIMR